MELLSLRLIAFADDVCVGEDSDMLVLTVDNCTSILENDLQAIVSISPNPSNGRFSLLVENAEREKLSWELRDANGNSAEFRA